ncbi:gamma-glutamyltransferase [Salicibibacter cibi]|uniref:Gamma-glutamyltransferase n=1 Tax=Salicibibacter cibi TaxID=2743001 RepID=A0A7T6Z899_9BACI|nr:gamma-glutamyltransferase [Salicibibacter cibi]QQK78670.1 gamma-glutamyltransferase [Salicibibacter cibi]
MRRNMIYSKFNRHTGFVFSAIATVSFVLSGCASEEETDNETEPSETQDQNDTPPDEQNDEDETDDESADDASDVPDAYGVSAGHPEAVDAGKEVLDNGGSAADAAIAAAYAISVVEPFASGIGGGGVALIQEQGEEPQAYDYREVVPEEGIPSSDIGVPGFVAGMVELHEDHGVADWQELMDPSIDLAESVEVSETLAQQLQSAQDRLPTEQLEHFYPGGVPLAEDANLEQPELADTLREIRDRGGEAFYEEDIGETLASDVEGLNMNSLSDYDVGRHDPVTGEFAGYEMIGAPQPLPGTSVIQMLQISEERDILEEERNSTAFIHDIAMSWRLARQFIETDFGDPDYVDDPDDNINDPERNAAWAEEISSDSLLPMDAEQSYGDADPNTTHITVVDDDGTVVSMTNTLTDFWGAGEYIEGFFLNNQMARFSIGEGEENEPEPGRRSVTWSSPLIIADEEGPVMGIGSPGGERIPIMLTQVVADWAGGTDLDETVEAQRFHLDENELIMEEPLPESDQREALLDIGYSEIREPPTPLYFGSIQALAIDRETDELSGVTDHRREGDWGMETTD